MAMGEKEKLCILKLFDSEDNEAYYIIKTKLYENELQNIVDNIINYWNEKGFLDWSYDDLVEELEKEGVIEVLPKTYTYEIYA